MPKILNTSLIKPLGLTYSMQETRGGEYKLKETMGKQTKPSQRPGYHIVMLTAGRKARQIKGRLFDKRGLVKR